MSRIGTVIDGKYEILTEIGRGGMSVVYLARDRRLNKQWAVKEVKRTSNGKDNEVVYQSLMTEASLMKKLDHPRLPRIVDIIEQGDTLFVVMDYIEGRPMNKVLKNNGADKQKDIKAWEKQVVEWGIQLCGVLKYLHTREPAIVYRDMKPSNIMLKPDGSVVVFDFGIAREYKEGQSGDTAALGTRGYAAPEQFGNNGQTDARTDIYNLGVTMYEMLTGKDPTEPPYTLYPIRHWNPQLSDGMEWIIQKCTQPDPEARFQTAEELMYYLRNVEGMDRAVVARQKRKLISFFVPAMLTVVFLLVGIAGTIGKISNDRQNYNNYVAGRRYTEATQINAEWLYAYQAFAGEIAENQFVSDDSEAKILETSDNNGFGAVISDREELEEDDIEDRAYLRLCFDLGECFWNYYEPQNMNSADDVIEKDQMNASHAYLSILENCMETHGEAMLEDALNDSYQYDKERDEQVAQPDTKSGSERVLDLKVYLAVHDYAFADSSGDAICEAWRNLAALNENDAITGADSTVPEELRIRYFEYVDDFLLNELKVHSAQMKDDEESIRDLYEKVLAACEGLDSRNEKVQNILNNRETCEGKLDNVFGTEAEE